MLLVADSLTGQDAVNLARAFDERVGLTGIVLTRVDGDGRGGAALSMRAVTGKPIKLIGTGEKTDALEDFHPSRIAGRILGMGDVVSLVEKAAANIDAEKAARTAERMRKGQFDLTDMREQLLQMANMGGISGLMGMMPGIAKMKNQIAAAGIDDKIIKRQVAVIDSMTRQERKNPDILKASRKKRIAAGAGLKVEEVNKLLKMHRNMADMMKAMGSGKRGPMAGIAQAMGFGGGMKPPSPEEMKAMAEKMPGGAGRAACPTLPKDLPAGLRQGLPNLPGLTGLSGKPTLPGLGGFPGEEEMRFVADDRNDLAQRSNTQSQPINTLKENQMSVVIRLARAGTKKRPVYHVVVADSRFPRDGRFIERLGHFNPLLPKDNEARLKLDMDKVKAWLAKGAQPSDRVTRFLDAAGVVKRAARNNPEKAVPRKERKAARRSRREGAKASSGATTVACTDLRRPDRRRAWRARRGEAVDVHRRSAGREALRPAGDQGRRAPVRGDACPRGQGSSGGDAERHRHPRGRRAAQRHRALHRARKTARDRRGRILPRRPDRARRGRSPRTSRSAASSRSTISAPATSSRSRRRTARPCCCRSPTPWCRRSISPAAAW